MNIFHFLRIIWAYRLLILASAVICFVTGTAVVELVKPRYEAQSRVMLDVIKPDPITGEVISSAFMRAYTKTQTEMIKDQQVARMAAQDLKWDKDPAIQKAYRNRSTGRDLDFMAWATQRVQDGADANVIMGSNILEITYASSSPEEAKRVSDALLKAYMDMTLQSRRETARRNAEWYEAQAEKAKAMLFTAEGSKAAFERANGIVLQDDKIDLDSARLSALAAQGSGPMIAPPSAGTSPAATQLATFDAELAELSKSLGPNHPQLLQLKLRRSLLAQQVANERNNAATNGGAALNAARASSGLLEQQKAKVMGQREKVEQLRLMQDEIDLRRDQYNKSVARAAQLRQESQVADAGVVPLANAVTPQDPVFPKKLLIMGVSVPAGIGLGIFIAILLELLGRRVRSVEDLSAAASAPVLAVIRNPNRRTRARRDGPRGVGSSPRRTRAARGAARA